MTVWQTGAEGPNSSAGRISTRARLTVALPLAYRAARLTAAIAREQEATEERGALAEITRLAGLLADQSSQLATVYGVELGTRPVRGMVRAQLQRAMDILDALVNERLRGGGSLDDSTKHWVESCFAALRASLTELDERARHLPDAHL